MWLANFTCFLVAWTRSDGFHFSVTRTTALSDAILTAGHVTRAGVTGTTLLVPYPKVNPYPEPVVFQWQSSGNPVCLELRPQCTLECHWKKMLVASVLPVFFKWSFGGFPVVFQCVPIMQINTGSPLEHHWVLASVSMVPVASQCTCGSSGLPVWSVQWYPSVVTESDLEVIRSGHFPACDPLCTQLVWWELFELNGLHLTCNPKYTKTIMVLISKTCTG